MPHLAVTVIFVIEGQDPDFFNSAPKRSQVDFQQSLEGWGPHLNFGWFSNWP